MRKFFPIIALAIALCSCQDTSAPLQTKVYSLDDSTAHASMKFSAELPCGTDKVSQVVREELLNLIDDQLISFLMKANGSSMPTTATEATQKLM